MTNANCTEIRECVRTELIKLLSESPSNPLTLTNTATGVGSTLFMALAGIIAGAEPTPFAELFLYSSVAGGAGFVQDVASSTGSMPNILPYTIWQSVASRSDSVLGEIVSPEMNLGNLGWSDVSSINFDRDLEQLGFWLPDDIGRKSVTQMNAEKLHEILNFLNTPDFNLSALSEEDISYLHSNLQWLNDIAFDGPLGDVLHNLQSEILPFLTYHSLLSEHPELADKLTGMTELLSDGNEQYALLNLLGHQEELATLSEFAQQLSDEDFSIIASNPQLLELLASGVGVEDSLFSLTNEDPTVISELSRSPAYSLLLNELMNTDSLGGIFADRLFGEQDEEGNYLFDEAVGRALTRALGIDSDAKIPSLGEDVLNISNTFYPSTTPIAISMDGEETEQASPLDGLIERIKESVTSDLEQTINNKLRILETQIGEAVSRAVAQIEIPECNCNQNDITVESRSPEELAGDVRRNTSYGNFPR